MKRMTMLGLTLASLSGCVVYDTPCGDDGFWSDGDEPSADHAGDTGQEDPQGLGLTMVPDTLEQGETAIVSLVADREFDWTLVTDVQLYGDVTPCAMQARPDELLLTLSVDPAAAVGGVDLVVETADGDAIWAQDVLFVVEAGSGSSGSGSSGSGSSGSDSSGSGSSGSGSSGSTNGCG